MTRCFASSWQRLALYFAFPDGHESLRDEMLSAYAESHRAYHTQQHLYECLLWCAELGVDAETELALWFHDAVYRPRASDNEVKSAQWARHVLVGWSLPDAVITQVYEGVLATAHTQSCDPRFARLLDIDLSILGAPAQRFAEYEQQVRREYAWVPHFLYRKKRAEVLQKFMARERLFLTDYFYQRLEKPARDNLRLSLDTL